MDTDDGVNEMTTRWLAATALALVLAGCGDDGGTKRAEVTAPEVTVTQGGSAPAATPGGTDAFVSTVRQALPEVAADRRDEEIAAIAEQACSALAGGEDADTVVAGTRTLGTLDAEATDHATARELIKLAIDTVCPGRGGRADEF